jgi:hypothetical protein
MRCRGAARRLCAAIGGLLSLAARPPFPPEGSTIAWRAPLPRENVCFVPNPKFTVMPSNQGERALGVVFIKFWFALSKRGEETQERVVCLKSFDLLTRRRDFL